MAATEYPARRSRIDDRSKRDRYEFIRARLWANRASFDSHWREIGDYLLPRRTRFWSGDRNRGDKRNQNIIDSTGRFSARTLQSGLHAGLTSPARPWMKLSTPDPDLAEFGPVKEWLHVVTQRMLTVFLQTNLYNVLPMIYGDMGVFGTAAMSVLEDSKDLFRCYPYPLGSYVIGLNARGLATTFFREYQLSVRQVIETFALEPDGRTINWAPLSVTMKHLWDRGDYEAPVDLCWGVLPNEDARADRLDAKYLPWTSCHYEKGEQGPAGTFLKESGFRSFPIMAPRWDVTGEDSYGTDCPGMTALGDVKQLQIMHRRKGQLIAKVVDPPLVGPPQLRTQKTSLLPGDVTYVDISSSQQGLKPIHESRLDGLQYLTADIGECQYRIQRAFYEDLFLMLARSDEQRGAQPVTAREVEERHEEKLLALGPVLERTNDELLDPLIDRAYMLMDHAGLIPEPPTELEGVDLKVEYISIMAQAQKLVGVVGQDRFLQTAAPLIQFFPEIVHKINIMQVIDDYGDMLGIDPRIVRTTEEAEQRAGEQAQQQKAIGDAQQAMALAKAAKDASGADMGGDTALNRIVQSVAGAA